MPGPEPGLCTVAHVAGQFVCFVYALVDDDRRHILHSFVLSAAGKNEKHGQRENAVFHGLSLSINSIFNSFAHAASITF